MDWTEGAARARRPYFYGLDLIRFGAALIVTLFHLSYSVWALRHTGGREYWQGAYSFPDLAPVTWIGWVGVEIFFVISGLVIAGSAEGATPAQFLKGRVLRLYPAAWICIAATFFIRAVAGVRPGLASLFASLVLWPVGPFVDAQYWTLGVEIVFYACVYIHLRFSSFDNIGRMIVALTAGGFVTLVCVWLSPTVAAALAEGNGKVLPLYYAPFFALGMIIRQWAVGKMTKTLWAAGILAGIVCVAELLRRAPLHSTNDGHPFNPWNPVTLFAVAVLAMIASVRFYRAFDMLAPAALAFIKLLGKVTYPLYLLHFAIGVILLRRLVLIGVEAHAALGVALIVTFAAATAVAVYEARLRRWIGRAEVWGFPRVAWLRLAALRI